LRIPSTTFRRAARAVAAGRAPARRTILMLALFFPLFPAGTAAEEFKGENAFLSKLSQEELVAYFGLRYALNSHQMKQYLSLGTAGERSGWIDRYWIDLDPTPATEGNERRDEHEARVRLARKLFAMKKPPGWDRRGETLIRYGMPATRRQIPADIGFYRMIPPGEMWYYQSLDMLVAFQNFNLKGEFIFAFETYGMTGRQISDRTKAIAEYLAFTPSAELANVTSRDLEAIAGMNPDNIDYIADPDIRAEQGRDMIAALEAEKNQKRRNNFDKYLKENPVVYSIELRSDNLPVFFDITKFSGGGETVRTEVNFEVPAGELSFAREGGTLNASIKLDLLVRDLESNIVAKVTDTVLVSQTGGDAWQGPGHIPGQLAVALKPGYYRLGLEARDIRSNRAGGFRASTLLSGMSDRLSLSDILFASSIRETGELVKFQKGNLQVVPHPLHAYRMPYPLTFYFEIYGLDTDREGLSYYTVEYRIVPMTRRRKGPVLEEPPPAIDSSFETSAFGSTQAQRFEIATDNLWEGSFNLVVTVRDRRTRQSAERRANFSILGND